MPSDYSIFEKIVYFAYIFFIKNINLKPLNIDFSDFILTTFSFILSSLFAFFIAIFTLKRTDKLNKKQRNTTIYSTAVGLLNEIIYNKTIATNIIEISQLTTEEFNVLSSKLSFELFKSFPSEILELLDYDDKITFLNLFHETQIHQIPLQKDEDINEALTLIQGYIDLLTSFENILTEKYISKSSPTSI